MRRAFGLDVLSNCSAKYKVREMSAFGSWRQFLRSLCPVDASAVGGSRQAEAIGLTMMVVVVTTAIYLHVYRNRDNCVATGAAADANATKIRQNQRDRSDDDDNVDLWSGEESDENTPVG